MPKTHRKPAARSGRGKRFSAKSADKHALYQLAVQSPVEDARFLARLYRGLRGKEPRHLREDFCGTAFLCAAWVRRGERTAEGFDISRATLEWGRTHNFPPLGERARRIHLQAADVRERSARRPDVRCAQNFSYFVFKERAQLLDYFARARRDLARGGIFVLDIYGGPDTMEEEEEEREIEGEAFTYVWDQRRYVPATGDYEAHIHFRFPDGTEMHRAFSYDWRLWTLPEVRDALQEAGFRRVDTYWEGTAADGENGNGIFRKSARGENCPAWVTYLVAYD